MRKTPTSTSSTATISTNQPCGVDGPVFLDLTGEGGEPEPFFATPTDTVVNTAREVFEPFRIEPQHIVQQQQQRHHEEMQEFWSLEDLPFDDEPDIRFTYNSHEWTFNNLSHTKQRDENIIQLMQDLGHYQIAEQCADTRGIGTPLLAAPSRDINAKEIFGNEVRMHFVLKDYLLNNGRRRKLRVLETVARMRIDVVCVHFKKKKTIVQLPNTKPGRFCRASDLVYTAPMQRQSTSFHATCGT